MKKVKKMNVKPRKLIIVTLLILMCALFFGGCSPSNPYKSQPDDGYVIKNLDVTIDVCADRSMQITEKFVYNFTQGESHGFYRDFAINSGERIRDIKVSSFSGGNYSSSGYDVSHEEGSFIRVKVGDSSKFVPLNTDLSCVISYTMITPKVKDHPDTLMVNAIGQGFNCKILSANVSIILPASVEESEYYLGSWGSSNIAGKSIIETVNDDKTKISLQTTAPLDAFNGLTVYYGLPKGAFTPYIEWEFFVTLAIVIVLISLAIFLKLKFGRSEILTPISTFYPPKSDGVTINPVELGFLIDNTCSGEDVTSLIFYWASNGYLKISNEKEDKEIRLLKIRNLAPDAPEYEIKFFNKIFENRAEVMVSELSQKMYEQVTATQTAVKAKYEGKLYSTKVNVLRYGLCALTCVFAFLSVFLAYLRVSSHYFNFFGFVALVPIVISNAYGIYLVNNWLKFDKHKMARLALFVIITVLSSLMMFIFINYDVFSSLELASVVLGIVAPSLIAPFIVKRTDFYTSQLNEIIGFREFLIAAEKDKLEMLIADDPEYYYNILPYANVLGVSDVWEDKFKNIQLKQPAYYSSSDLLFDMIIFNSFYRSAYRTMATTVVSRPSSAGRSGGGGGFGGFGGGGGFSGGGFGGGGGGRW